MVGEVTTSRVPLNVFFPEVDQQLPHVSPVLLSDLYPVTAQGDTVLATLVEASRLLNSPGTSEALRDDLHTALEQLFVAVVPFAHDLASNVLDPSYYATTYNDWCIRAEALDPHMMTWYEAWLAGIDVSDWGTFSQVLIENVYLFLHVINTQHQIYVGTARELDYHGTLSVNRHYPVADLIEDFLNPYVWLLELVESSSHT